MSGLRLRLIGMLVIVMLLAFASLLIGVNFGLRSDVAALASTTADAGVSALARAITNRTDQVRDAVLQATTQGAVGSAIVAGDRTSLNTVASNVALGADVSFVTMVDAHGTIVGSNRPANGSLANDPMVKAAQSGDLQAGFQMLNRPTLTTLSFSTASSSSAIAVAAPVRLNGKIVGVIYAGTVLDKTTQFVDDVARVTGGMDGIIVNNAFVATSLTSEDGTKFVGQKAPVSDAVVNHHETASGLQDMGTTKYFGKYSPLTDWNGNSVGALWFGTPYAQFNAIVNNTLRQIVLWGLVGLVLALIVGTIVATRIGRAIVQRSEVVNESAQQLKVLVVGAEVSGDHVSRTRDTLEEIKALVHTTPMNGTGHLQSLAQTAVDDVVVIDTLTNELSLRLRDAAIRVERLSEVAQELDELVAGAKASRN